MFVDKLKTYIEKLSTIKFLGVKDFLVVDIASTNATIVHFRSKPNPLKLFSKETEPKYCITSLRECTVNDESNFEVNREIRILAERYKLKNSVLVLLINKYKYFNLSISKENIENREDLSIEDLIRKQLPPNFNKSDFILHYEKTGDEENAENFFVTITRKQEIEKHIDIINNDAFQLTFAMPSAFMLNNKDAGKNKVTDLVEIGKERIIHYHLSKENRIIEDEHFFDTDYDFKDNIRQRIIDFTSGPSLQGDNIDEIKTKFSFHSAKYILNELSGFLEEIKIKGGIENDYIISSDIKYILAYKKIFNDDIFAFETNSYIPVNKQFDTDKTIATRIVFGTFLILFFLLVVLNMVNLITDHSIDEISVKNENLNQLKFQVEQLAERNEQIKSDIKFLNSITFQGDKVSRLLKIISVSSVSNLVITDMNLKRKNNIALNVNIYGESGSKDEVVRFIKNLEAYKEFANIELISIDKKRTINNESVSNSYDFQFALKMVFNENKNS